MTDSTEPDPIEVTYTATLRYEPWEVDEFDITEQSAIEILENHILRGPSNFGEFSVRRDSGPRATVVDGGRYDNVFVGGEMVASFDRETGEFLVYDYGRDDGNLPDYTMDVRGV